MTTSSVGVCAPKNEPPTGWEVLLALLATWGVTLRLVLVILLPITAVVAIYLGPVGVGTLLTAVGGGYGTNRFLARRRRRQASRRT